MFQRITIALGAGLASGVLFVIPTKGTLIAAILSVIAPLPLMIAGLGFTAPVSLGAVAVGTLVTGLLVNPIYALVFIATVGAPAWGLSMIALRRHAGVVVACVCALAIVIALGFMGMATARFGSYQAAIDTTAEQLTPNLSGLLNGDLPTGINARDFANWIVRLMPAVLAAWGVLSLSANLWIAARTVEISGLLRQPWTNVPDTLRLPRLAIAVLVVGLVGLAAPATAQIAAIAVISALTCGFALQGLGAIHAMTRGRPTRRFLLTGVYLVAVFTFPWPLALLGLLGVLDCLLRLPRRPLAVTPVPTAITPTKL